MASEIDESLLDNMFGARDDDERDAGPEYDDSDSDEDAAGPGEVDEADWDEEPEDPKIKPSIYIENTQALKSRQQGGLVEPMHRILDAMAAEGFNVPLFLDALSWGTADCVQDARIRYARSSLLHSEQLPGLLQRWWKPPRTDLSRKSRPRGAKAVVEKFAAEVHRANLNTDLNNLAASFSSNGEDDVKEETLTSVSFARMIPETRLAGSRLWDTLRGLAYTPKQQNRNTHKNPDKVSQFK